MIERICKKCNKIFIPAAMHVFVDGTEYFCSWTCYNHRSVGASQKKRPYKVVEVYDMKGELLRRFSSASRAAEHMGFSIKRVQDACRCGKPYNGFMWKYKD